MEEKGRQAIIDALCEHGLIFHQESLVDCIVDKLKEVRNFEKKNGWTLVGEENYPITYESGDWDGLRSDVVLVRFKDNYYRIVTTTGRCYSGVIDGCSFVDFYDERSGFDIENVIEWKYID